MEWIVTLALDPAKKEQEVKKERKQLYKYAIHHQRFDWVEALAQLQFQRAMLYMRDVRQARKEFSKNLRLGRKAETLAVINKYGIGFTTEEGATGLMLALHHGQNGLATELMKMNAAIADTDKSNARALII